MKEYWEITHDRGVATLAVWYMNQDFELRGCDFSQHTTDVDALPTKAAERDAAEGDLTDKQAITADRHARLADLIVRVPGVIEGKLTADDDLHGQLDKVFAVGLNVSRNQDLRRARLVHGAWVDFNALLAAQTPAEPPLIMKYKKADSDDPAVDVTAAQFDTLIDDCIAAEKDEAAQQREVGRIKSQLRTLDRRTDRNNKRWYEAWTKFYPAGTEEGDAARSQVTTEQGTQKPTALEINHIDPHPDRTATVFYEPEGGARATTLELLYKLPGDLEYGHSTPVTRPSQVVGPFPANTVVDIITRVANSTPGVVWSEPKSVPIEG